MNLERIYECEKRDGNCPEIFEQSYVFRYLYFRWYFAIEVCKIFEFVLRISFAL